MRVSGGSAGMRRVSSRPAPRCKRARAQRAAMPPSGSPVVIVTRGSPMCAPLERPPSVEVVACAVPQHEERMTLVLLAIEDRDLASPQCGADVAMDLQRGGLVDAER